MQATLRFQVVVASMAAVLASSLFSFAAQPPAGGGSPSKPVGLSTKAQPHDSSDKWKQASLIIPFLGEVPTVSKTESVPVTAGERVDWTFTVHHTAGGQFLFAEYIRPGAKRLSTPPEKMERFLKVVSQKITGIPKESPQVGWTAVLENISKRLPLEEATQVSISYVQYSMPTKPEAPLYLVTVRGVNYFDDPPEYHHGVRFIADSAGKFIRFDDRF